MSEVWLKFGKFWFKFLKIFNKTYQILKITLVEMESFAREINFYFLYLIIIFWPTFDEDLGTLYTYISSLLWNDWSNASPKPWSSHNASTKPRNRQTFFDIIDFKKRTKRNNLVVACMP